ncbi:MAG: membrane protein insertion efficiency factor YidD [Actinobacteria bacterium]|nr:membrane protein insertion efficiency factor YidD [Actinomycetota bacterium]
MKIVTVLYQVLRSLLSYFGLGSGNCIYYPTCSQIITESIENKGFIGTIPTILKRALICNPIYQKFGKNWQY